MIINPNPPDVLVLEMEMSGVLRCFRCVLFIQIGFDLHFIKHVLYTSYISVL